MRILVIEDGYEYTETLARFLADGFVWERAGSGPRALTRLAEQAFDGIFLDMRFDRVPDDELLGDVASTADRFNGDPVQARNFLQDHQGNYVLAALREAGVELPVLVSYDFEGEARRWRHLREHFGPVDYLPDGAPPKEIARRLRALG